MLSYVNCLRDVRFGTFKQTSMFISTKHSALKCVIINRTPSGKRRWCYVSSRSLKLCKELRIWYANFHLPEHYSPIWWGWLESDWAHQNPENFKDQPGTVKTPVVLKPLTNLGQFEVPCGLSHVKPVENVCVEEGQEVKTETASFTDIHCITKGFYKSWNNIHKTEKTRKHRLGDKTHSIPKKAKEKSAPSSAPPITDEKKPDDRTHFLYAHQFQQRKSEKQ